MWDFDGWEPDERSSFCSDLHRAVFGNHDAFMFSYSLSLRDVKEVWREGEDIFAMAYRLILILIMRKVGEFSELYFPKSTTISLVHDRCNYDGVLVDAFNFMISDNDFVYRKAFTTMEPKGWEDCLPLQIADLLAYEAMKESHRLEPEVLAVKERHRRKGLEDLPLRPGFNAHAEHISREDIIKLREIILEKARKRDSLMTV